VLDEALHAVGHIPAAYRLEIRTTIATAWTIRPFMRDQGGRSTHGRTAFHAGAFAALDGRWIERRFVTLHVGAGTFLPVKADDFLPPTAGCIPRSGIFAAETAAALNAARARARASLRSATSLRLLERGAHQDGTIEAWSADRYLHHAGLSL
jgi:S-adenosylmethionine:tRNA ribosyltransferase-isomerase